MKYKKVFFDIDHTLWDFDRNARETLQKLYEYYEFSAKFGFSFEIFFSAFEKINFSLWDAYGKHQISKEKLREERFALVFEALQLNRKHVPADLGNDFIFQCPRCGNLMPNAETMLQTLTQRGHEIYAITNGFKDTQEVKIEHSVLKNFLREVITSECAGGAKKPDAEIFDYAFRKTNAAKDESVMVGDRWDTDIIGGINFGIDVIYYAPQGLGSTNTSLKHYEITDLLQICDIV